MPRELQCHLHARLPLDRDRLAHHPHRLPGVPVTVARRVGRVGRVDIQVLLVDGEDRQAPRPVFVVPDRDPGHAGSPAPIMSQPGATRWTQYRSEGSWRARCGSFARIADREKERSPEITQLLLPSIGESPPRAACTSSGRDRGALPRLAGSTSSGGIAPGPAMTGTAPGAPPGSAPGRVRRRAGGSGGPDAGSGAPRPGPRPGCGRAGHAAPRSSRSGRGRCGGRRPPRATRAPA